MSILVFPTCLHIPRRPATIIESTGMILDAPLRIGIWLMPDNRSTGELEDFVGSMIPSADPVWPRAEAFIDGIPPSDRKFAPSKTSGPKSTPGWRLEKLLGQWAWR